MPNNLFEIRSIGDIQSKDERTIEGYAAVFNSLSQDLGGFKEIIKPGAFARSLQSGKDVKALAGHNWERVLGSTKSGTLQLREDARGLHFSVQLPETGYARDLYELVKRQDVSGASFAFRVPKGGETFKRSSDGIVRELSALEVLEVSVVGNPAYEDTQVAARSLELWRKESDQTAADAVLRLARMRLRLAEID